MHGYDQVGRDYFWYRHNQGMFATVYCVYVRKIKNRGSYDMSGGLDFAFQTSYFYV